MTRGAVAALESSAPYELSSFKARLFWLGRQPFSLGKTYKLKLATQEVECSIESIQKVIDASSLETVSRKQNEMFVGRHEVAELTLHTRKPIAFDVHADIATTGRFVIVDGFDVAGGASSRRIIIRIARMIQKRRATIFIGAKGESPRGSGSCAMDILAACCG